MCPALKEVTVPCRRQTYGQSRYTKRNLMETEIMLVMVIDYGDIKVRILKNFTEGMRGFTENI